MNATAWFSYRLLEEFCRPKSFTSSPLQSLIYSDNKPIHNTPSKPHPAPSQPKEPADKSNWFKPGETPAKCKHSSRLQFVCLLVVGQIILTSVQLLLKNQRSSAYKGCFRLFDNSSALLSVCWPAAVAKNPSMICSVSWICTSCALAYWSVFARLSAQMPLFCSSVTGRNQTFGPGGGGEFVGGLEVSCVVLRGSPCLLCCLPCHFMVPSVHTQTV